MTTTSLVPKPTFLIIVLIVVSVLLGVGGQDLAVIVRELIAGAVGSPQALADSLNRATPLILGGLAVTVPFRAGMFNLGVEGQLIVGALAAAWVGAWQGLTAWVHVPAVLTAGWLAGAAWAWIAAKLKAAFHIHELLSTIMLNYLALYLTSYLANYPLRADTSAAATELIQRSARLPTLPGPFAVHLGVLASILASVFFYVLLRRTVFGYKMAFTAENPTAAALAGIRVNRVAHWSFLIGSGLAGVAGAIEVCAVHFRFMDGLAPGLGFDGVAAAIIGVCQPLGTFFGGLLLGLLKNGAVTMDLYTHVPREIILIIEALLILFVASQRVGFARGQLKVAISDT